MGRGGSTSSSSSLESSNYPAFSSGSSSLYQQNRDLSTDLRLGLSISTSQQGNPSIPRYIIILNTHLKNSCTCAFRFFIIF